MRKVLERCKSVLWGYTTRAILVFLLIISASVLFSSLLITSFICTQDECIAFFVSKEAIHLVTLPGLYMRYYLGIGAYVCVLFSMYLAYSIFWRKPFFQEWERIGAFLLLTISIPALGLEYVSDPFFALYTSGCVGLRFYTFLTALYDGPIVFRLLQSMCLIGVVLVSRFTLTTLVSELIASYLSKSMNYQEAFNEFASTSEPIIDTTDTTVTDQPVVISTQNVPHEGEVQRVYELPQTHFTTTSSPQSQSNQNNSKEKASVLEDKLKHFGIKGRVIDIKEGPVVTLFEYQPEVDSKISKIIALEDDLALALQAMSIRIIAPVPGTSVVGFEVANRKRRDVLLSASIDSEVFDNYSASLPIVLGKDTIGKDVMVDLTKMPHLLVAGSTGSGKSVALNSFLMSLLCKRTPDELRLILIDPKRLEFSPYANIAHLVFPIVTEVTKVAPTLRWVIHEMERRYELMAQNGVRNITDYVNRIQQEDKEELPYIVIIIDELADVMMLASKEVEALIARITQMARAAGIHMIVATQRPSVDVITGVIKVNFPSRISFRVTSKVDSRTILDAGGAEKLLGRGDMLFLDSSSSVLKRVHGAYISDDDIQKITSHIRNQCPASYEQEVPAPSSSSDMTSDQLYHEVKEYVQTIEEVSISLVQRKFRIGYNRSARIIEKLETEGVITSSHGGKTRKVVHK